MENLFGRITSLQNCDFITQFFTHTHTKKKKKKTCQLTGHNVQVKIVFIILITSHLAQNTCFENTINQNIYIYIYIYMCVCGGGEGGGEQFLFGPRAQEVIGPRKSSWAWPLC